MTLISSGPFTGLKQNHYRVIYADPAWGFRTFSGGHQAPFRGKEEPYPTMSREELLALPVSDLAAKDCCLVMWILGSHIDQAFELAETWGFKFNTDLFYWVKTGKHDPAVRPITMGHWSRKQVEPCFLFTRGKPGRQDKGVRQLIETDTFDPVIYGPRREHSRKPDETRDRIERLIAGPYVELFSRSTKPGWDVWGNQVGKFDNLLDKGFFSHNLGLDSYNEKFADILGHGSMQQHGEFDDILG